MSPVRILIADDQELVRTGFRMILDEEQSLSIVGEACDGLQAVELAETLRPDVVLMDIRMPGIDGLEATRRILARPHDPPIRVLVLTTFDLNEYVYEALRAGASGFLLKDVPTEQLVAGVHVVAAGEALLAPSVTRRLIEEFAQHVPAPEPPPELPDEPEPAPSPLDPLGPSDRESPEPPEDPSSSPPGRDAAAWVSFLADPDVRTVGVPPSFWVAAEASSTLPWSR